MRQRAVEERHAERPAAPWHAVELVEARGGEASRDALVVGAEDVHGEAGAVTQCRIALGFVIDAHQDLRRVQRHGAERADRQARGAGLGVGGGEDGHAGGEVTENTTKVVRSDHRFYVSGRGGSNQARASPGRPALAGGRASNVTAWSTLSRRPLAGGSKRCSSRSPARYQWLAH